MNSSAASPAPSPGSSATTALAIGASVMTSAILLALGHAGWGWTALALALGIAGLRTGLSLNSQIGIGVLLGVLGGVASAEGCIPSIEAIRPIGRLFILGLKMMIAPMIMLSIIVGVGRLASGRQLARLGRRTILLYLSTMACAVTVGLIFVNLFEPGIGGDLANSELFKSAADQGGASVEAPALGAFLLMTLNQVLTNPVGSLAQGRILPIVLFAILFGVALARMGSRATKLVEPLSVALDAIMQIIGWLIRLAPIGIFALVGHLTASIGLRALFEDLAGLCAVVIGATAFHAFVVLPAFARALGGVGPADLFRGLREALLVAFATSSSAATLPVTTRNVEENFDVPSHVSSFVLPLGATVNMDGTALYEAIAAIFVANVYGIDLSLGSQIVVFIVAMLTAVGAPGIPSAGMVTMIVVLEAVGLPAESVAVLLTVDRFLDTFRTAANVEGDAVVAICVSRE